MKVAKTPRISTSWLLNILLVLIMLVGTGASVAAAPVSAPVQGAQAGPRLEQGPDDESQALVEFRVPDEAAIEQMLALGADLAEYVRKNDDGSLTINAFVTPGERALYESMGFQAGATIEDQSTWEAAKAEREAAMAAEKAAHGCRGESSGAAPRRPRPSSAPGGVPGPVRPRRRDHHYARRLLHQLRRQLPVGLGAHLAGPAQWRRDNGDGVEGSGRGLRHRNEHVQVHRRGPVHVSPRAGADRRGRREQPRSRPWSGLPRAPEPRRRLR